MGDNTIIDHITAMPLSAVLNGAEKVEMKFRGCRRSDQWLPPTPGSTNANMVENTILLVALYH